MKILKVKQVSEMSRVFLITATILIFGFGTYAIAQDIPISSGNLQRLQSTRSSPFPAPPKNDTTFIVDDGPGLDTGCTYRSGGPLVFNIPVTRFVGDVEKLKANKAIKLTARLRMPAFDVDFSGAPGYPPERDRVFFNGHAVQPEFLQGINNEWILNSFEVPVEWIKFADDPKDGGTIIEKLNEIRIDIDTESPSSEENWCTSIDWAALSIEVARPNLLVHGIAPVNFSNQSETWTESGMWTKGFESMGIPYDTIDMGRLDTIGANAKKIENKTSEMKQRFGVNKINIVAHSKGGIDSRHFLENKNDVARLTQIGTPNAGSPLADYLQIATLKLLGIGGNFIGNLLAGGLGGYQLTTPYMAGYNLSHGYNSNTMYISLAGHYSGGGILDGLLNSILPGDDDTIVPVSSVHSLPYAAHLDYSSSGSVYDAQHTKQTSSKNIFDRLINFTSAPMAASTRLTTLATTTSLFNTAPLPGIAIQGLTQTYTVPIDNTGPGSFSLIYSSGNLDMVLISPSGRRIDPAIAQADPAIAFEASEVVEGLKLEVYTFDSLEVGKWSIEVTGTQVSTPPGEESYLVSAWLQESAIGMSVTTDKESYILGNSINISATLVDSSLAPLLGASVLATLGLPDNTVREVTLSDNGFPPDSKANDGIYTGVSTDTTQTGIYQLAIIAQGDQPPFSRTAYLQRPVSASRSSFDNAFSDQGIDNNLNGLYDELVIECNLNISDELTYLITGELTSLDGTLVAKTSTRIQLYPGNQQIQLKFDGNTIYNTGLDGPYTLNLVRLAEETPNGDSLPLSESKRVYETKAYNYINFEHESIVIKGTGSDSGVDINGNAQFDQLEIRLDTDMTVEDTYQWSARLVDQDDKEIAVTTNSGFLNAGLGFIIITFDGATIQQHGVNGPYKVVDLLIYGSNQSQVVFEAYTTAAYNACQFEGGSCNQPPVADAGADKIVNEGLLVKLDGTKSSDPKGENITYKWIQIDGPAVVLDNSSSPTPSFQAPFGAANTLLTFQLVVNDGTLDSTPDEVTVTVSDMGPSLHGMVSKLQSKTPVEGARVELFGIVKINNKLKFIYKNTITNSDGSYAFTALSPGNYVVKVFSPKKNLRFFPVATKVIKIEKSEDEVQNFVLR